ncbi:MAG: nicotinamide mononucleotide transporter [Clostridia bacterium]|nr:nicotinamide mononucleotide transporter [Clostridia bacterium]
MNFKQRVRNLWGFFTTYEKIWFFSIVILSIIFAFIFPEEETQGVNGKLIIALYLVDIFSNVLCELLISKQSKWNFLVSLVVEVTEILISIVLSYRFATLATTLFFWIPIDIISFFNWHRHKDMDQEELTIVRKLTGWQEVLVVAAIAVWTVVVGYLLTLVEYNGIFSDNPTLETIVVYLDACCSAVGIANGLFILFRYREQWIAWYINTILETIMNILAGQWILLILKAGYFTNTTYGYIKWTKYIKERQKKIDKGLVKE